MRAVHKLIYAAAIATAVDGGSAASAQMNPIIMAGPHNYAMGRIMALRSRQMREQFDRPSNSRAPSSGPPPSPITSASLSVSEDSDVSRRVRDLYIGDMARSGGQAQAAEIDRRLGNIRTTFARLVSPYGLRANELDDVMAAHMMVMWMAANQKTQPPTTLQAQAVRRQMRNVFASGAGAIADGSGRQSFAEYVMYETCMTVLTRSQLSSRPDLDKTLADAVNAKMSTQGYDLRHLRLTDRGLVRM